MKTLSMFLLALFSLTIIADAKVKRYPVTKIIKAIEKDADEALKEFKENFECRFGIENYKFVNNDLTTANVKGKDQAVAYKNAIAVNMDNDFKNGKKILYLCKLEKHTKDDGTESVRIVALEEISR